ncbi:MAG: Ig-like domain-containing protein [Deltaproteobacteria bacterium]|nr:MAG: Ig-like domain-containing protein [Deltaproteobacteria bacterium]
MNHGTKRELKGSRRCRKTGIWLFIFLFFAFSGKVWAGSLTYGDAEPDVTIDANDILRIRQNAGGYPDVPMLGNADATGHDCRLAVSDALGIRQYMLGFRPDLPVFTPSPACWAIGLSITNGDGQVGAPNQTLTQPLEVTLNNIPVCTQTISGCTLGGVTITYDITSDTTGGAVLPGSVTTLDTDTDSSGNVSTLLTLGSGPGTVTVVASVDLYSADGAPLTTVSVVFTAVAIGCGISSVGPITGCPGITEITINGTNFGQYPGTVTFNGTWATVTFWSDTIVRVLAPSGNYNDVMVTPLTVTECNLAGTYYYDDQPPTVDVDPIPCDNDGDVTVSAACSDAGSGVDTCEVSINGYDWYPSPHFFNGLTNTNYTAVGRGSDNCGNIGLDMVGETFEVDTWVWLTITYPTGTQNIPEGAALVSGYANTDITTVTVTSDQGHNESSGVDGSGNWSVILLGVSGPSMDITARGTDDCGNTAIDFVTAFVVPPQCSITSISPTTGCPGSMVSINGSNFGAFFGTVYFDETVAPAYTWMTDYLEIQPVPGGNFSIVKVVRSGGGMCTMPADLSYDNVPPPPPTITSPTDGAIVGSWVPTTITCTEGTCEEQITPFGWQPCNTGFGPLTDGPYTLTARCTDSCSNSSTATSNFTVDTMGPWVNSTTPCNFCSNEPTGVNIEIEFNEDMDKGSVESGLTLSAGTSGPLPGNFYWRSGDTVVFATPGLLSDSTWYCVDLIGATDLAGNPLGSYSFWFGTDDCTSPQVISKSPTGDTLVDSSTLTQITVIFNESMDATRGQMDIRDVYDNTVVDANIGGGSYGGTLTWTTTSISNDTLLLTLDLPSPIQEGSGYQIEVSDLSDLNSNWINSDYWSLITRGPSSDITPPQLIITLPFDGQEAVPRKLYDFVENSIMLGFDEAFDPSTVNLTNITLTNASGPVPIALNWDVGDGPSPYVIILTPELPLDPLETYTVGISSGIEDSAGNNFISQNIVFTTANQPDDTIPPQVEATVPGDGWIDLDRYGIDGEIGFTEGIDNSTVDIYDITLEETDTGIPVKGLILRENEDPNSWRFDFQSTRAFPGMEYNTRHTLTISSSSITDICGNPLAGYSWTFSTVPDGPGTGIGNRLPRIWNVWPDTNATSFENGNVTVNFKINVWDDDGDPLTVWVEDEHSNSWFLTYMGSDEYEYNTPVPGDLDSGDEPGITYGGWETFTYYVDDGQPGHTISVSNQAYVWPTVDLLNQVSPINGEAVDSGGPTTLVLQNVDTINAVVLMGQYMNFNTWEPGMFINFPEFNQTILPGLSPGFYLWVVMQVASVHGTIFDSGGAGAGYQGMGVSNFNVVDPTLGSISGTISYAGASTGPIQVQAYDNTTFTGDPVGITIIPGPGNYTLYNLDTGGYYIQSFMDTNVNMTYDTGVEPYGMYDVLPAIGVPDQVTISTPTESVTGIDITITDP